MIEANSRYHTILKELIKNIGAEGAILITPDGLPIASEFSVNLDEDTVSAMGASLLSLSERVLNELDKGELEEVYVKGKEGYALFTGVGDFAVLGVLTDNSAKLGLILVEIKKAINKLLS